MLKLHTPKSSGAYSLAASVVTSLLSMGTVPTAQGAAGPDALAKTGTLFKANADMQAVLDALAALNGKPIESLTPEEARMPSGSRTK